MEPREVTVPSGATYQIHEPTGSFAFVAVDLSEGKIGQSDAIKRLIENCVRPKITDYDALSLDDLTEIIKEVSGFMTRAQKEADPSSGDASS